jgi:hypothetical protein
MPVRLISYFHIAVLPFSTDAAPIFPESYFRHDAGCVRCLGLLRVLAERSNGVIDCDWHRHVFVRVRNCLLFADSGIPELPTEEATAELLTNDLSRVGRSKSRKLKLGQGS